MRYTLALHVVLGTSYVYFSAVGRWSMCLSQHLLFLLAMAREFILANCNREQLPRDRQLVGLVWSISIGRNLNVISHKSQRLIAVVVTNLMVPRTQPKIYNNHNLGHKWRSSAFDENRSCVHATPHSECRTKWEGCERHEAGPISILSSLKTKSAEFFCFCFHFRFWFVCYLCVWTPLWLRV